MKPARLNFHASEGEPADCATARSNLAHLWQTMHGSLTARYMQ